MEDLDEKDEEDVEEEEQRLWVEALLGAPLKKALLPDALLHEDDGTWEPALTGTCARAVPIQLDVLRVLIHRVSHSVLQVLKVGRSQLCWRRWQQPFGMSHDAVAMVLVCQCAGMNFFINPIYPHGVHIYRSSTHQAN